LPEVTTPREERPEGFEETNVAFDAIPKEDLEAATAAFLKNRDTLYRALTLLAKAMKEKDPKKFLDHIYRTPLEGVFRAEFADFGSDWVEEFEKAVEKDGLQAASDRVAKRLMLEYAEAYDNEVAGKLLTQLPIDVHVPV